MARSRQQYVINWLNQDGTVAAVQYADKDLAETALNGHDDRKALSVVRGELVQEDSRKRISEPKRERKPRTPKAPSAVPAEHGKTKGKDK